LKKILALLSKYEVWLLAVLKPLGFWGIGALAVIDAAAIPVPLDLFIAGYVWADKAHFYLPVLIAALGSAIGGLLPFLLGRAGGEIFLMKRINRQKFEKLRDRFERQEFLAVAIPSILPPPTPWKLVVFGAGVFEMRILNFMLAVFTGRTIRYLIISAVTIEYGPAIIKVAEELATRHRHLLLAGLLLLLGLLVLWAIAKRKSARRRAMSEQVSEDE
jgi:membrane protein YqaA with SNARE-associated domain